MTLNPSAIFPRDMYTLKGIIKSRYPVLSGRDWIKGIDPEDLRVIMQRVHIAGLSGRMGGLHRAKFGKRDTRGRFTKES